MTKWAHSSPVAAICSVALLFAVMSFALSGLCRPALAQPELVPAPKQVDVDWPAVARDVRTISPHLIAPPQGLLSKHSAVIGNQLERYAARDREALRPLAHLNGFVAAMYPGVDTVPIPVLAPFGTGPYLAELVRVGESRPQAAESFLSSVIAKMHFIAKTTGYDAILTVNADWLSRHNIADVDLVQVHLGGAGILYESDKGGRRGGRERRGELVKDKDLQALYPDLRRHVGADDVTYNFFKYRVPYFASIPCQGKGPPLPRIVRCAQVEPVLQGVLRDLQVIGGAPIALKRRTQVGQPRPTAMSPTFRFFAPGNLMPGTSQANKGGVTQRILHGPADLVFPIKEPDTFANSQLFMHGGDCHGRKIPLADGRYKCRQNPQKILQPREGHPENYAPPWRDNYCEVRGEPDRQPKDCPAPVGGHEGQDIRPRECVDSSGRCKIDLFDVVAVTTGDAWWTPVNHLRLIARDGTDLYYMYLHMSPDALSRAGMRRGEPVPVVPGKKVGEVGNWLKTEPAATTAHLHFEIRKQREMCGSYGCTVSPYWTLIRAYERLINAQGTEVTK